MKTGYKYKKVYIYYVLYTFSILCMLCMSFPVKEFKEILLYIFLAICVMLIPILLGPYVFPFLKSFPGIADITLEELTNYFLQSFLVIVIALRLFIFWYSQNLPLISLAIDCNQSKTQKIIKSLIAFVPLRLNKPKKEEKPPNLESWLHGYFLFFIPTI